MKQQVLSLARAAGGFALARRLTGQRLRILCYHGAWTISGPPYGECLFIAPDMFAQRMDRLARSGHPVLDLDEAVERLYAGTLPRGAVAITLDDGWRSSHSHMMPVLKAHGLPATLYVSTYYVEKQLPVVNVALRYIFSETRRSANEIVAETGLHAEPGFDAMLAGIEALSTAEARDQMLLAVARAAGLDPAAITAQFSYMNRQELAEWEASGLRLELHTHRHRSALDTLAGEIADNRRAMAGLAGEPFAHFCYPSGECDTRAEAVLAAAGIRSATTTRPGLNAPGAPRFRLRRFLDGPRVTDVEFDAYLSGALEPLHNLKRA
ncbi:MAG: polysaccharide deacetylase family protein [Novosphingobium sp.]